jgi:hypothetical protein
VRDLAAACSVAGSLPCRSMPLRRRDIRPGAIAYLDHAILLAQLPERFA